MSTVDTDLERGTIEMNYTPGQSYYPFYESGSIGRATVNISVKITYMTSRILVITVSDYDSLSNHHQTIT